MTSHSPTSAAGVLRDRTFRPKSEILERSAKVAAGLEAAGIRPGDTVALLLRNDFPYFEASFGAASIGACPVPLNWHGGADELAYVVDDSGARVVIGHADLLRPVAHALASPTQLVVATPNDIAESYAVTPDARTPKSSDLEWERWLAGQPDRQLEQLQAPFSMVYTSGTTGRPKGVRRQPASTMHVEDLERSVAERTRIMGFEAGMRVVVTGPMYHSAPNAYALGALQHDGFVVLQPRFHAEQLLGLIEEHAITHLSLVPTMFVRLLRLDRRVRERYDLTSLRHVVHGAAPCPVDVKRAMIDWWGPIISEYYGGTETGVVTGCDSEEWLAHPGTVGRPLAGATVRIYDENGGVVDDGSPGEVYMRSKGMPDFTYEGLPDERAECERDGLITCGDLGYLDAGGFLHLCGRRRDMVISGGVNIYPVEIESHLLTLTGVRDAAVFGIPDDEFGEALAAAIELEHDAELAEVDVRRHVRSLLAGYKVPKVVTFHETLPREDSGKIFKERLRAPYWEHIGRSI